MNDPGVLCARCGLCCDGALFDRVAVTGPEAARLVPLGLPLAARADGTFALQQPCGALRGPECRAYRQRPQTCRDYECLLFRAFRDGEVELDEALALVAQTHALRASGDGEAMKAHVTRHFRGRFGRRV